MPKTAPADSIGPQDVQTRPGTVRRFIQLLTEPSDAIVNDTLRVKARFLSASLILMIVVFTILQGLQGHTLDNQPVYLALALISLSIYIVGRTEYVRFAGIATTLVLAVMPFLFLSYSPQWDPTRVVFNIVVWPLVAALFGSQFLTPLLEALLITSETSLLLVYCRFHPALDFMMAIEPIFDQAALSILVLFFTWMTNYYITQLEYRQDDLQQRQRELEVYTSVLTHDLGNDMQVLRGSVELLEVTDELNPRNSQNLETALAVSDRMGNVVKLFSSVGKQREFDFLSALQEIATSAEQAFSGMKVEVKVWPGVDTTRAGVGILLPLVVENLLRNTAEHAGTESDVTISMWMKEDSLELQYRDSGPGIPESIRPRVFQKGVTTRENGKGLGLYLSQRIVESYGGSIELVIDGETGHDMFRITIPTR
ncbi:MAG: sensor histidine kinase [Candidatus Thorarchaeota archaeon SMTZ1-45]